MGPRSNSATLASCVLLLATVAGCGSNGDDSAPTTANDASASTPGSPSTPDSPSESSSATDSPSEASGATLPVGDAVEPGQAMVVGVSNVDGTTTELASPLVDAEAVDSFLVDADPRLADEVRAAVEVAQVPPGSTLFGSVVAVGCDEPTAVSWELTFDGVQARARLPKSTVQCLVPVTSVALFLVEDTV